MKANKQLRLLTIFIALISLLCDEAKAQWTLSPSLGVEFAFPQYESFNYSIRPLYFTRITNNPAISIQMALDLNYEVSEKWSIYSNFALSRFKIQVLSIELFSTNEEKGTGQFNNIRTCIGARFAFNENFRLGLGVILDYSSNFRFYNEDGERLDTEREYNITRDLGINLNAIRSFGKINVAVQINKGLIPIVSSKRKPIMESRREIEPLSAIILTFGYGFEW